MCYTIYINARRKGKSEKTQISSVRNEENYTAIQGMGRVHKEIW